MSSSEATSTTQPDFGKIQTTYTKRLLLGRHPHSFPRYSEMWHHCHSSTTRLRRINKGHRLWKVLENKDADELLSAEEIKGGNYLANATMVPRKPQLLDSLNGISVDMKAKVRLHFGMSFFIMNFMEEVLCVNKWDEVLCKPHQHLDPTDKIMFKIIDLLDVTNPGGVKFGKPMWLQIIDSAPDADNSIQYGVVLGAKLFDPPPMGSMHLDSNKSASPKRQNFQTISNTPIPEDVQSSKDDAAVEIINDPEIDNDNNENEEGTSEESSVVNVTHIRGSKSTGTITRPNSSRTQHENAFKERGDKDVVDVCGATKTVKITTGLAVQDATKGFRSKQAWHLGQWVIRSALRESAVDADAYVHTLMPVFMEQDLYCLATSMGSSYKPWPMRAQDPSMVRAAQQRHRDYDQGANPATTGPKSSSLKAKVHSITASRPTTNITDEEEKFQLDYGCLRKVVKRGLPYEHLVDRRCVWNFCAAESVGDLKLLSAKEQIAQKIMKKAKYGLELSKSNRLGSRKFDEMNIDGVRPLVGGETFASTLRQITSWTNLRNETDQFSIVRQNENKILDHFDDMLQTTTIADITNVKKGGASSRSGLGPCYAVHIDHNASQISALTETPMAEPVKTKGTDAFLTQFSDALHVSSGYPTKGAKHAAQRSVLPAQSAAWDTNHPMPDDGSLTEAQSVEMSIHAGAHHHHMGDHHSGRLSSRAHHHADPQHSRRSSVHHDGDISHRDHHRPHTSPVRHPGGRHSGRSHPSSHDASSVTSETTATTATNRHHEHNNDHVLSFGEKISSLHKSFSHINAQITSNHHSQVTAVNSMPEDHGHASKYGRRIGGIDSTGRTTAIQGEGVTSALRMAQKLQNLKDEDSAVQQALMHRDRVNQYKNISDVFADFLIRDPEEKDDEKGESPKKKKSPAKKVTTMW